MYEDVLIATDGSDVASNAAAFGISIARALGGTVHALAVDENDQDESQHQQREADAAAVATAAADAGCASDSIVRQGRPANEILACAEETGADLIVVGTHGRTGFQQVVFGSVAIEVIRDARRPVCSIGPNVSTIDDSAPIDDILLATDGTSGSAGATDEALSLARSLGASVQTLYAVDGDDESELREHGEQTTAAIAQRAGDLDVTGTVTDGPAHEVIRKHADSDTIDLLVMGAESITTENQSTIERLVLGSVSQRVLPKASVPVMTVRTIDS